MQLSLHADYSCRVLIYLATKSKRCSIEEISDAYGISRNHLVKLVHEMGKLELIETIRGRGGGIQLARPAEDIRIGDVIRKMEPSLNLVECFQSETNSCIITGACGLRPWLKKAMDAFMETLDEVTLADVVQGRRKLETALRLRA
jgi:Rrf2 family nitric oxide-sensitive transcriptional repressor